MKRYPQIPVLAAGLAAALLIPGGGEAAAGSRLHGEPPATNYALSYDGSKMIVKQKQGQRRFHDIIETRSGKSRGMLERSFISMIWGEDSNTAYASGSGGRIYRISFAGDGATVAPIALTGERGIPRSEKPRVVGFPTPIAPVLFARGGGRLYRCALHRTEGKAETAATCEIAARDARGAVHWLIDVNGQAAARIAVAASGEREFQTRTKEGEWRPVFRYTPHYTELKTIGGVQNDNRVWALSNRNRERVALVRLDITTGEEEAVYEHRRFDIEAASMTIDGTGDGSPMLVAYSPGYQEVVHFEPRLEAAYAALREKLGERVRIDFKSADSALNFAVVEARNPAIYRRWYLLDLEKGTSRELSAGRPAVYDRPPAPSRPVSFAASDGLLLHGYLTLPQRPAEAGPSPMVLMLHGGPWERDRWPDPGLGRFLGSLGYAVLRLNYRGSIGYAREFIEAGKGTLFGILQQDVLDAAAWAVAEGYAARDRIALFGGSFGGFLALVMLGRHPGAFHAGIALNPIADAVGFWRRDWSRLNLRVVWREFLASRDLPEAALARISPVNNVRNLDAPVLLLVGARDRRAPPEHSFELFDLLRVAGKPAELVEYRALGHNLSGGSSETRERIAGRIVEFLDRHLPVERR